MRITSTDIQAVSLLAKRVVTGCLVGGKYILAGSVASTQNSTQTPRQTVAKNTTTNKRRIRQQPPLVIEDSVYDTPAMVRLNNVKLEAWQQKNLQPSVIDEVIKQHYDFMTANGLKPGPYYFDV